MTTPLPTAAPLTVSVRALCAFTARSGDLDLRFTPAPTAAEGMAGHSTVVGRRGAGYVAELPLTGAYPGLLVSGRADGYDPAQNLFFLDFSGLAVRSADDIRRVEAAVDAALDPVGHKVKAIVNYDRFSILPELIDDYIAMVKGVVERHYHDVTRYTASTFLRMKLGEALAKRQMAPKISESEADARQQLTGSQ